MMTNQMDTIWEYINRQSRRQMMNESAVGSDDSQISSSLTSWTDRFSKWPLDEIYAAVNDPMDNNTHINLQMMAI